MMHTIYFAPVSEIRLTKRISTKKLFLKMKKNYNAHVKCYTRQLN